ncbi:MAG: I78 family peptidase inhibitor [Pseudomonadota bacterium]
MCVLPWGMEEKQKERTVVLKDRPQTQNVKSPALWLSLAAFPIVLAMVVGIIRGGEAPQEPPVETLEQVTIERMAEQPQAMPEEVAQDINCDFESWVGQAPSQEMVDILKGASTGERPYRILPPGSMMTMDHNPNRVNFDVSDDGLITRVWCG